MVNYGSGLHASGRLFIVSIMRNVRQQKIHIVGETGVDKDPLGRSETYKLAIADQEILRR